MINKAYIKKEINTNDSYAYTKLYRLSRKGLITKIIKGKYTLTREIYAIATNIHNPSYLSFWSCSQYKGYTEQMLNTIQVATTKRYKKIRFDSYNIEFIKVKSIFGYDRIGDMFIAEDERLLIDALSSEKHMGNFDEIEKTFINTEIDIEKIISYLKRINSNSLIKRTGYMLERYKGIDISENFLLDKNYVRLTIFQKSRIIDKKWRVKHDNKK